MADQTIATPYPNTPGTTDGPASADRQPALSQQTHPSTGAHEDAPAVLHADDHDEGAGNRAMEEK